MSEAYERPVGAESFGGRNDRRVGGPVTARDAVIEHLAAFNAHDTGRILTGFTENAVWATGQDVVRGLPALAQLFDDGLWELAPSLTTVTLVADEHAVAAELYERITIDGEQREFAIAAFFRVENGLIRAAKVYREGTADIS